MRAHELSPRERQILKVIIHDYITSGEPVGSRSIARRHLGHLSPATIRNVMADLEEVGYLSQPHASAGRIPTDSGYRFYVDSLMQHPRLSKVEESRIEQGIRPSRGEAEELVQGVSRILSDLSRYASVVLAPKFAQNTWRRINFVHLNRERILVVLMADSGLVQQKVIAIDELIEQPELDRISNYLNSVLGGVTLHEIRNMIIARMAEERDEFNRLMLRALELSNKTLEGEEGYVCIGGTANIAHQPEFADINKMKNIFAAFEEKSKLVKILDQCLTREGLRVIIGRESEVREMRELSLIAAPYKSGDHVVGVLGIVGPKRIAYDRMVALVDCTARLVSKLLTEADV
ncbi:MAG: heat-inducible transcription repressor HrcA [Candidatus Methylomirabilis oxygeniifera]|uniref:Heat-inducible transcription repressor HrcA n=1 Tax=Methylomirabilis oxygeniifera TaxID=671143 RepID=D5MI13_METO1|nr:MAG: heat-inducible transcription repressor HrcA [Candidatus Methylomirabilis oxyfera]CBE69306.1 Heat-inducible transcription repressor [Candidatus Methylomirabilis oxyfera]